MICSTYACYVINWYWFWYAINLQNLCKLPFLFYFLWPWISSGWPSFADFSKWEAVKQTNSDMMIGTWGKNLEEITTTTLHYSHHHFIEVFEAFVKLFTESTNLFRLVLKGIKIVKNHFTIFRNVMAGWSKNINLYSLRT